MSTIFVSEIFGPQALPQASQEFARDVLAGLRLQPKRLSSKYFYDARGSELFEAICEQPEYYLTRTELAIMHERVHEIADTLGPRVRLVEYGSGAGSKTRLLLSALIDPVAYVPVEISRSALDDSVGRLAGQFPSVEMLPLCADFTRTTTAPRPARAERRTVVYFPGSTLGNFDAQESLSLLRQMRRIAGADGAVLIGLDLKKDAAEIEAAYNDRAGLTREFTLNLLARINRELNGDFDIARFEHRARYNALAGRIETYIVSLAAQRVSVCGHQFSFGPAESILVEYSNKYSREDIQQLARRAELQVDRIWTDADERFAVVLLTAPA